jgi:glycosyltransferase involved in cell wall biosynthesis
MRILIVAQHFPPERGAVRRLFEFARFFVRHGHEVSVLTAIPNYPDGLVPARYRGHFLYREEIEGVRIFRSWVPPASNRNRLKRMFGFAVFSLTALVSALRLRSRPDLVLASMPPVNTPVIGWIISRFCRAKFVVEVRDLEPEACEHLGNLKRSVFTALLRRLVHGMYRRADRLVAVTDGLAISLREIGIAPEQIVVIKSGVGEEFLLAEQNGVRARFGWEGKFLILYSGTLGRVHALETVIGAARRMSDRTDIRFVFVGDGETRSRLESLARSHNLNNVEFLGAMPLDSIPAFLAASDLLVESLVDVPTTARTFPAKLFEYMASGRPIIFGARGGEALRELDAAGGALAFAPDDSEGLRRLILRVRDGSVDGAALGRKYREHAARHHRRERWADDYLRCLVDVRAGSSR